MRRTGLVFAVALAIASGGLRAAPPTPVVVELFTSEGCSDCPPADTLLEKLIATQPIAGAEIIGLGQHVDYWDRLGWKDRFSSAALTNRQQLYQTRFGIESIYTPQMVVDGRAEFVGSDASAARKAIEKTLAAPHGRIHIDIVNAGVRVTASDLPPLPRGDRADIIVMVTERGLTTDVKRGENQGRMLAHAPVVRYLATIGHIPDGASGGTASAGDISLAPDWRRDRLAVVAFVQQQRGRTILASASAPLAIARP
ncbi:MAG TPA: DUF1223 domain-containing protein [Vicinamibacterales bacterium]|nr:DUF1223 domain-containing protein [Vicinamibacterales bacterium]